MAISLTHATPTVIPDDGVSAVGSDEWNAEHILTASANIVLGTVSSGAVSEISCTAAGRAILDDADSTAQRVTLGLVIGTHVQAYDAELAAIAGLASAADKAPYFTGSGTAALADLTAAGRALLDDASAAAQLVTLGAVGKQSVPIPASGMTPNITNGAAAGVAETATNDVMFVTLDFDATTSESAQFSMPMPKSWDESTITFQPIWSHPVTAVNFGVVWELSAVAVSDDDAGDVAFGTGQTSTDTGGTTDDIYIGPESSAITIGGSPAEGDFVFFKVARLPANGSDTLAVDARLHGIRLFITTNAGNDA